MQVPEHSFDVSLDDAKRIQQTLHEQVVLADAFRDSSTVRYVGGADVAFLTLNGTPPTSHQTLQDTDQYIRAPNGRGTVRRATHALGGVVLWDRETGAVTESATAVVPVTLPYIPGFLSFREGPAVLASLRELSRPPEVMVYDGCGIAHPRGLGIASHLSIITGIPGIGCAKSRLCGNCGEPDHERGSWTRLDYHGDTVGTCLRTRTGVKPVYVSPGSGFSVEGARSFVLSLSVRYRLPEPTRLAHQLVTRTKARLLTHT